jgi:hypothetical protein
MRYLEVKETLRYITQNYSKPKVRTHDGDKKQIKVRQYKGNINQNNTNKNSETNKF